MFTVDFNYFDKETRRVCGSQTFFYDTTIDESMHTETAQEQQRTFLDGLRYGYMDDLLSDTTDPQIYAVCPVQYSETDLAVGVGPAVITNIVLLDADKQIENEIRAAVLQNSPDTQINVYYRNV